MRKMKKMVAAVLTATLVIGSCVTVLADPVTSGGTDGAGTSEGHLDKKVINVVLPTVPSGSTPFAYTMDPERLIQETSAAKYDEGTTFPDSETDTGVYFLTGEKTYANTSNTLQAINKSSQSIKLTVKVKATQNTAKDIALATSSTVATTGDADLYLALKVGNDTQVVSATEASVVKVIPGVASNFETAVEEGEYTYREKADATSWKAVNLSMTGAVSELAIASDTTAPTVNVTWEYAEAASTDTDSTDVVDYTTTPDLPEESSVPSTVEVSATGSVTVAVTIGTNEDQLTKLETSAYSGDMLTMGNGYGASYSDGTITFGADIAGYLQGASAQDLDAITFTATFGTGDDAYTQTFKFVPAN